VTGGKRAVPAGAARTGRRDARPRWYFSLRSPYSWLSHHDLTNRYPEVAAALEWRPFWEPDARSEQLLRAAGGAFGYVPMSRAKSRYILQDVRRLARERGLEPTWPVDRDPVWEIPHLAYLAAAEAGRGREFAAHAYRARWQEGRNICARATVAEIAAGLGLPGPLADAVEDEGWRRRGVQALLDVDADGVFGVPFFVHGFEKFWGIDRLPAFVRLVSGAGPGPAVPVPDVGVSAGGDEGHAGGCG